MTVIIWWCFFLCDCAIAELELVLHSFWFPYENPISHTDLEGFLGGYCAMGFIFPSYHYWG